MIGATGTIHLANPIRVQGVCFGSRIGLSYTAHS